MATVGEMLRERMAELGLTQGQVVVRTGVSQSLVSKLISGQRTNINAATAVALARGLQMDVGKLVLAAAGEEVPESVPEAIEAGLRPNARHAGVHQLLDLHEAGKLKETWGIELSAEEEEGLRTYGRSGPAVETARQAIEVVLQWREWKIRDQLDAARRTRSPQQ